MGAHCYTSQNVADIVWCKKGLGQDLPTFFRSYTEEPIKGVDWAKVCHSAFSFWKCKRVEDLSLLYSFWDIQKYLNENRPGVRSIMFYSPVFGHASGLLGFLPVTSYTHTPSRIPFVADNNSSTMSTLLTFAKGYLFLDVLSVRENCKLKDSQ